MNYGEFLIKLRPYCINKKLPNETLVNEPIQIIIDTMNIKKEKGPSKGEPLHYDVSESSKIIHNKLDISPKIRNALRFEGIEEKLSEEFSVFYADNIDPNLEKDLIADYLSFIQDDPSFKPMELNKIINLSSSDPCLFLAKILVKSLKEDNLKTRTNDFLIWENGENYVKIVKGDILSYALGRRSKKDRIVVIPVNTSFDTHITTKLETTCNPVVSKSTLHGKLLQKIYSSGISEADLEKRIQDNLILNGYITEHQEKLNLPIGTVATLDFGNTSLFLLATSKFDSHNKAHSSKTDVRTAIEKLLIYYDNNGQGYDIYIPLLGTGMSRAGLSNQESFNIILETITDNSIVMQGKYNIVIQPKTIESIIIERE